jgi:mannose-binding lectin 1
VESRYYLATISFWYTETVGPEQFEFFKGFHITLNTSETDEEGETAVYFSENSIHDSKVVGRLKIRNGKYPIRLRIYKTGGDLIVDCTDFMFFRPVFKVLAKDTPEFGYFTISAQTKANFTDNNDLWAFRVDPTSEIERDHIKKGLVNDNRKIIETNALKRRETKRARRAALLPSMLKFLADMGKYDNDLLKSEERPDMREAFALVDEAHGRSIEGVAIDTLKVFLCTDVQNTLEKAGRKVRIALDQLEEATNDMNEVWTQVDTNGVLRSLEIQLLEQAQKIQLDKIDTEAFQESVKREIPEGQNDQIVKGLIVVSVVELAAYLLFFAVKHRKTHGLKKFD